jgi:hypothetical protein
MENRLANIVGAFVAALGCGNHLLRFCGSPLLPAGVLHHPAGPPPGSGRPFLHLLLLLITAAYLKILP